MFERLPQLFIVRWFGVEFKDGFGMAIDMKRFSGGYPPPLTDWLNEQWNERFSGFVAAKIFHPLGLRVKYSKQTDYAGGIKPKKNAKVGKVSQGTLRTAKDPRCSGVGLVYFFTTSSIAG